MCLFDEEEPNIFHQGGTHAQYCRWIGEHPGHNSVWPRDALVVWRIKHNKKPHC